MGALEDVNYVKMTFVADPLAMEMLKAFGQEPVPLLRPLAPIPEPVEEVAAAGPDRSKVDIMIDRVAEENTSLWASTPVPNFVNGLGEEVRAS